MCNIEDRAIPFEKVSLSDLDCEKEGFDYFLAYLLGILMIASLLLYILLENIDCLYLYIINLTSEKRVLNNNCSCLTCIFPVIKETKLRSATK